jgi:hypothetical protein
MSPRYKPKETRDGLAMFGTIPVGSAPDVDPLVQLRGLKPSDGAVPYRAMRGLEEIGEGDSCHSWWGDRLMLADSRARANRAVTSPIYRGRDPGDVDRPGVGTEQDIAAAEERLRLSASIGATELRDMSSSGNPFVPVGVAVYVAQEFAVAARARASLFAALPQLPLPQYGLKVEVPRLTGGGSVAVITSDNSTVTEVDPTTALASSGRAYISGDVDVSRQLLEFSRPGWDQVMSADLGRALGVAVDSQLVTGSNTSGQTEGLATVSGINTVTYTDASPTVNKTVSKIWAAFQAIVESGGGPPEPGDGYLVVLAPRRLAQLSANSGSTSSLSLPPLPGRAVATSGVRLTLGGGTEDEIFVIARDEVFVGATAPILATYPEVGSSTLTVRLQARQSVAAMFSRQPKAICRISGTGLVAPTL